MTDQLPLSRRLDAAARETEAAADATAELTRLLDHYEQSLFGFLVVLLGDRERARDCAQDTFIRAYQNLQKGRPVNVQWLFKVGRNRALDLLRRGGRELHVAQPLEEMAPDTSAPSQRTLAVQRALQQLSPGDREILYLAEVDGFNSIQIAEMLDIRSGAVRMRLFRAHARFRRAYEGEG